MATADPIDDTSTPALEALLRWYLAMGVDASIGEEPLDRYALSLPVTASPSGSSRSATRADATAVPPPVQRTEATGDSATLDDVAARCDSLDDLRSAWAASGCDLSASAAHMLFSGGIAGSKLMIVAGAPSSDDEREGLAFRGKAGQLLDAMLRSIGHSRETAYLTYVIPWRPPGNRSPSPRELAQCLPFARRHIELAKPDVVVCLGDRAAQPLLGSRDSVNRLRARWLNFEGSAQTIPTLVTFSLDFLLQQPLQKRLAWADLSMIADRLRA